MSEETQTTLVDLYAQLRAPLPDEAITADNSRGFLLTGIKSAYVVERLNETLGLCGWGWWFKVVSLDIGEQFVLADIDLYYADDELWSQPIRASGDQRIIKGRIGDAKKGAVSDALKKAASFLGVGERAYKGLLTPPPGNKKSPPPPPGKAKHWIDDPAVRKRFWAWAKGTLKLTEGQIYKALNAKQMHDFTGSMTDAKRILEEAAFGQHEAGPDETHPGAGS